MPAAAEAVHSRLRAEILFVLHLTSPGETSDFLLRDLR
jgi:hypothetical protein